MISAEKLAALVESLGAIVWEANGRTFQFTFVSSRAESVLGFPVSAWLNDPEFWRRHTHPDDVERCTRFCLDATRRGRDHQFEYRMVAADGRTVWLRDIVTVKSTPDGTSLAGVMLDITQQKADEDRVRRMERFQQALLENSSDNIAVLRPDGLTVYQSRAVERQLGYRPDELVGHNNFHIVHPEDRQMTMRKMVDILAAPGVVGPIRFRGVHKAGHVVVLETLGQRFVDEAGEPYVIINTRDITQQERLEQQVTHATKMEALGQLAGGVAHDFNNLITVISGYTETVREMLGPDDPHLREIDEIRRAADRAAVLTSQLLAFSRKQMLKTDIQDLNAVVRDVGSMIGRVIGATIELQFELASEPALVMADRGQMEQVLLNLALNARDAMPFGGTLRMRTTVATVDDESAAGRPPLVPGKYVNLVVSDTGSGMTAHVQRHVFEPFFTTKEPGKGTGLGLSTVYGIVKQLDGFVFVDSEVDKGTSFTIYLPAVNAARAVEPPAPPPDAAPAGGETVLLVEDERMVRDLTQQVLSRQGYRVLTAQNGAGALTVCQQFEGEIDLLVTDIVMAGMSGPELARRLETAQRVTRVLYISGYAGDSVLGTAGEAGVAFLQKPFTPTALARKVREVLDENDGSR